MQVAKFNMNLKMDGERSVLGEGNEWLAEVPGKETPIDVLTQMLESIHFKCSVSKPAVFRAPWGVSVKHGPARFYILTSGRCWLEIKGSRCPMFLVRGDLVFIPGGQEHSLSDPIDSPVTPVARELGLGSDGNTTDDEGDDVTRVICGTFEVKDEGFETLLSGLSSLIHVRGEDRKKQAGLDDLLRAVIHETTSAKAGSQAIISRLVHILFIQAIRSCGDAVIYEMRNGNLLAGLTDPEIGQAIRWMNQKPELPWTVASPLPHP
jgi:mannose-6-phosphate isomerase-like protein (cupin superfamily)